MLCSRVKLFHDLDHEKSNFNRVHTYPPVKRLTYTLQDQPIKPCKISQAVLQVSFLNVTTRVVSNFHSIKN
jgi:hypothetical protein